MTLVERPVVFQTGNHFVGGMRLFAGAIQRGEPAVNLDGEWLGDDPKAAYHRAARDDIAAWHTRSNWHSGQCPGRWPR